MKHVTILLMVISNLLHAEDTLKPKFVLEFCVQTITYQGDTLSSNNPNVIQLKFDKTSDITPIGNTVTRTYGFQFEVLESNINNQLHYFIHVAYYYKSEHNWILIATETLTPIRIGVWRPHTLDFNGELCTYNNSSKEFNIRYSSYLYLIEENSK